MSESEEIERLLRRSMAAESAPTLSPDFEERLAQRLAPRRLRLHASGMNSKLAVVSVLVPVLSVGALLRPYFQSPTARTASGSERPAFGKRAPSDLPGGSQ